MHKHWQSILKQAARLNISNCGNASALPPGHAGH